MKNLLSPSLGNLISCLEKLNMELDPILECAESKRGNELLYKNGMLTLSLDPTPSYVPWININNNQTEQIQKAAVKDLVQFVCKAYQVCFYFI